MSSFCRKVVRQTDRACGYPSAATDKPLVILAILTSGLSSSEAECSHAPPRAADRQARRERPGHRYREQRDDRH